jgi:hypothetical protein
MFGVVPFAFLNVLPLIAAAAASPAGSRTPRIDQNSMTRQPRDRLALGRSLDAPSVSSR